MLGGVLIARTHVHVEHQSRAGHRIGVIAMARPPGLLGIVAHDRSFLTAVKRLHRRIDVENPGLRQKRLKAIIEMAPQPHGASLFLDRRKGPPHRVLADDSAHAEKLGKNFVAAQRRDMRVALVPGKHRQHRRAQHIAFFIDFLKAAGLFNTFVADCPLHYTSPNAPKKRPAIQLLLMRRRSPFLGSIIRPGAKTWAKVRYRKRSSNSHIPPRRSAISRRSGPSCTAAIRVSPAPGPPFSTLAGWRGRAATSSPGSTLAPA